MLRKQFYRVLILLNDELTDKIFGGTATGGDNPCDAIAFDEATSHIIFSAQYKEDFIDSGVATHDPEDYKTPTFVLNEAVDGPGKGIVQVWDVATAKFYCNYVYNKRGVAPSTKNSTEESSTRSLRPTSEYTKPEYVRKINEKAGRHANFNETEVNKEYIRRFSVINEDAIGFSGTVLDVTDDVNSDIIKTEEDSKHVSCEFTLKNGFPWFNLLIPGLTVLVYASDTTNDESGEYLFFSGATGELEADFRESGDIHLHVKSYSRDYLTLAKERKKLIYPSTDNKGFEKPMTATQLVTKIIRQYPSLEAGIILIEDNPSYTDKTPISQDDVTDWAFLNDLADELGCVLFTETPEDKKTQVNFVSETSLTQSMANISLFHPARLENTFDVPPQGPNMLQIHELSIKLPGKTMFGKGGVTTGTDPETGETTLYKEDVREDGEPGYWILKESKLADESEKTRDRLMKQYESGNLGWEDVEDYFEFVTREEMNSRMSLLTEGATQMVVRDAETGEATYYELDESVLASLSPEEKDDLMSRTNPFNDDASGLTDEEFEKLYYEVEPPKEDETPPPVTPPPEMTKPEGSGKTKKPKRKRDQKGFQIEATAYGDRRVITRYNYNIYGLGRYTGKYYLYKKVSRYGSEGHMMKLYFTK